MNESPDKVINLDERDRKAELTLIATMHNLPSAGARRQLAADIGLDWEEYLRLRRKYKRVIERYERSFS